MRIYILRHGIAEARADRDDAERTLTAEGREKLRLVLRRAAAAKVSPSLILTSPLVRAVQTARIASEMLRCKKVERTDALLPSSSPEAVWREVEAHSGEASLLLAGHEPLLSETASWMLGAGRSVIDLKKGAMLSIGIEDASKPRTGLLEWLVSPKLAADAE